MLARLAKSSAFSTLACSSTYFFINIENLIRSIERGSIYPLLPILASLTPADLTHVAPLAPLLFHFVMPCNVHLTSRFYALSFFSCCNRDLILKIQ